LKRGEEGGGETPTRKHANTPNRSYIQETKKKEGVVRLEEKGRRKKVEAKLG
jgi:hypothetical protein